MSADEKAYEPIYALAQEKGLTIISHGGISGDDLEGKYCSPGNFKKLLENFPNLKLSNEEQDMLAFQNAERLFNLGTRN